MSIIQYKNIEQYISSFQESMRSKAGVNLFEKDSKTQALIDIFSDQLSKDRNAIYNAINSLDVNKSSDETIDSIGQTRGVYRLNETFAFSNQEELNMMFYVDSGTFGDLNSNANIIIPAGTVVWSKPNNNDLNARIEYELTSEAILLAAGNTAYANIRAKVSGSGSNVGANILKNHSYTNYTAGSGVKCTNNYSILNGRNRESLESYKYRISNIYNTIATVNDTRAKLLALNIPGVIDIKTIRGKYGIGTLSVIVLGIEYQTNDSLLNSVRAMTNDMKVMGARIIVEAPTKSVFDLVLNIKTPTTQTDKDKLRIENAIRRLSINYLRNQGLGGTISFATLINIIKKQNIGIILGTSMEDVISNIFVRRSNGNDISLERKELDTYTWSLNADEYGDLGSITINWS